jgi:hypothetical protein
MKVKVFISWSGAMSREVAEALRNWLPKVIQAVEPWMSSDDIEKGVWWSSDLANQLGQCTVGLICLTPENLKSLWIHFEAGVLCKAFERTHVCPYLFGVKTTDLQPPLSMFQLTTAEKEDTKKLVHTINRTLKEGALQEKELDEIFEMWWPKLEQQLQQIPPNPEAPGQRRPDREILEEILEVVRGLRLQRAPSRREIEQALEAGEEQFQLRQQKYQALVRKLAALDLSDEVEGEGSADETGKDS